MLKNLNAGIIRRLAANSLKSDKKRNLFLIITIAFSACLMLTLSLKILGGGTRLFSMICRSRRSGSSGKGRR